MAPRHLYPGMNPTTEVPVVGVLGGMGPAATADFYSKLVAATPADRDQDHVRTVIWSDPSIPDRTIALLEGGEDPTAHLIDNAQRLERFGATLIAMPCNTAHAYLPAIAESVDVPIVSMIDAMTDDVYHLPVLPRCVGLIATTATVRASLYEASLAAIGVSLLVPNSSEQDVVMSAIREIKRGNTGRRVSRCLSDASYQLAERGADLVLAGCTEITLAWDTRAAPIALLDPVQSLIAKVLALAGIRPRLPDGVLGRPTSPAPNG